MDGSFDLDASMSNGPNFNQQRSRPGGRDNNHRPCYVCGQMGHIARACPTTRDKPESSKDASQRRNGNGNGNGKGKQRMNSSASSSSGDKQFTDPANATPNGQCYMHPRSNHSNADCTNPRNRFSSRNNGTQGSDGRKSRQQQDSQPKPQHNRHGNIRSNHGPLQNPGDYCERCNTRGHIAVTCQNPGPGAAAVITCMMCKNRGHTHIECQHPLCCTNCRQVGHSRFSCRNPMAPEAMMGPSPLDLERIRAGAQYAASHQQGCSHSFQHAAQTHPTITKASFGPTFQLAEPEDELTAELFRMQRAAAAERRRLVAAKCYASATMYGHSLFNGEIEQGARFLGGIDPNHPQIVLPSYLKKTEAAERLFQSLIKNRSLSTAAGLISNGWNFFRDPRTMDAVARSQAPFCHGCSGKGIILNATFNRVPAGADVLELEDWDIWGVNILFSCHCCKAYGYTFVHDEGERMDMS